MNAKALMLDWLDAVFLHPVSRRAGSFGFITTVPSDTMECPPPFPPAKPVWCRGTRDSWNEANWSVSSTKVARHRDDQDGMMPAGWLPSQKFAKEWQAFVSLPEHPITSLP
jgi:hypothetical protein